MPLSDSHLVRHRNRDRCWKHLVGYADMGLVIFHVTQGDDAQTIVRLFYVNLRARIFSEELGHRDVTISDAVTKLLAITFGGVLVLEITMQKRGVGRVDSDL